MIDLDAQNEWIDSLKEKLSEIEELIEEAEKKVAEFADSLTIEESRTWLN